MQTNFSMNGYDKDTLQTHVPALVFTLYDGYYIYSPYKNTLDQETINKLKTGKGEAARERAKIEKQKLDYEIKEVNFRDVQESDMNAQRMNEKDFNRLVDNIRRDGCLTTTPLICVNEDGKYTCKVLDTSKLDDGRITPRFEPVEIVNLVKQYGDEMIPNITKKGLGYQFGSGTVDQQLGGGKRIEQIIYASVDKAFLHEVVNNLIENAIKYTNTGWIIVNVKADNYNVQIVVEDTGIGIPREELTHVFQKFYRVDNRDTREIGGTGLGLYLVKQRVEAMNGRIWAESELGKGTRFIAMFPRLSSEAYEQQKFLIDNQAEQDRNKI
jgi:signal transduction histidine kinase